MVRTVLVEPGQCIEDIALQEYGSIDGVTWLLMDNQDVFVNGYSTDLYAGTELKVDRAPMDAEVHDTLGRLNIRPSTNSTDTFTPETGGDYNNDHNNDHLVN